MEFLDNFINRKKARNERAEFLENEDRITHDIERKKLSHNEREMIAVLKREREQHLKDALKHEEKRRKAEERFRSRQMMMENPLRLLQ